MARDQHIPSCDFINLTKENYSDGQNQFSCAKSTAEFQSLFATGLFSALSSIPGDYLSEYLLTKKIQKHILLYRIMILIIMMHGRQAIRFSMWLIQQDSIREAVLKVLL